VNNLTHLYAPDKGFRDVSFELWPGEVLGIVGESRRRRSASLMAYSERCWYSTSPRCGVRRAEIAFR
jgi:putative phosphonate transport system ATP-binding protein